MSFCRNELRKWTVSAELSRVATLVLNQEF